MGEIRIVGPKPRISLTGMQESIVHFAFCNTDSPDSHIVCANRKYSHQHCPFVQADLSLKDYRSHVKLFLLV